MTDKMPRINPHATAIKQDRQLREQMKWLKLNGFKNCRETQEAESESSTIKIGMDSIPPIVPTTEHPYI